MYHLSIAELCKLHDVDTHHAHKVGHDARIIFERTQTLHQLSRDLRPVAYYAGYLHDLAVAEGKKGHNRRGRDILLETPLLEMNDTQRQIVAVSTAFHNKRWKKKRLKREKAYKKLDRATQHVALVIAATVRIADALDHSRSQTTNIKRVRAMQGRACVWVDGPFTHVDVPKAKRKADLWGVLFGSRLAIEVGGDAETH